MAGRGGERNGARARLQQAALELFGEHGYDRTTAAEIAARAGVTERTFFRCFTDKREALFAGEASLRAALVASIAAAAGEPGPLDTLYRAFCAVRPALEENRPFSEPMHAVITRTPALRERQTAKTEALAEALAEALRARGVAELPSVLAARIGMAAFAQATGTWLEQPQSRLAGHLDRAFAELKALLGGIGLDEVSAAGGVDAW